MMLALLFAVATATAAPDLPSVSAVSSSSTANALARCNDRVADLRGALEQIAAVEDDALLDHWPALLTTIVCAGSLVVLGDQDVISPLAEGSGIAGCAGLGYWIDTLIYPSPPDVPPPDAPPPVMKDPHLGSEGGTEDE